MKTIHAHFQLIKPRIMGMVMVACSMGFFLAERQCIHLHLLFWTLLGTALLAGGACTLNHYMERDIDGLMARTRLRPLPQGVLEPQYALNFGVCLVVAGCIVTLWKVNVLTAFLGLLSAFLYVLVYTPMKRLSWINTPMGAIPGAIPPLMGWAAATNRLEWPGWLLFGMVFLWQHIHFYAIGWLYQDDYRKAGLKMLPALESDGRNTFLQIMLTATALLPVSLILYVLGLTGGLYRWGALYAGGSLWFAGMGLALFRSHFAARMAVLVSVLYLPILLTVILMERYL